VTSVLSIYHSEASLCYSLTSQFFRYIP